MLAYNHSKRWHPYTCTLACTGGFIACVQYAHENGLLINAISCILHAMFINRIIPNLNCIYDI